MNGDGRLDLVTGLYQPGPQRGTIGPKLNDGRGNFPAASHVSFSISRAIVTCIVVADFNHDGILDVVASDFRIDATVGVLLGRTGPP